MRGKGTKKMRLFGLSRPFAYLCAHKAVKSVSGNFPIGNNNIIIMFSYDQKYMRQALQLARQGYGSVSPNPMVGSVIVAPGDRVIGRGWHRLYGQGHAEVNAIASVSDGDRPLLGQSTMYVTLEPCSHYGKTPPCAKLIIDTGIPRVVVGSVDPFAAVSGRGLAMLRDAGVDVVSGVMSDDSRRLNAAFMTAHTHRRPFVTLKWAQSADGWMDARRDDSQSNAYAFSTAQSLPFVHRLRGVHDAVMVGSGTVMADNPRLDNRLWPGLRTQPLAVVLDRRHRLDISRFAIADRQPVVLDNDDIADALAQLYSQGVTSVLVEGGATLLNQLIDRGLWDAARIETAPVSLDVRGAVKAPPLPDSQPIATQRIGVNTVQWFSNNALFTASHPMTDLPDDIAAFGC